MFSTMLFLLVIFTVYGMEIQKCFLNAHGSYTLCTDKKQVKAWRDLVRILEAEENQHILEIIAEEAENQFFGLAEENEYSSPKDLFDTFLNHLTTGKVTLKRSTKKSQSKEILKELTQEFNEKGVDLVSNRFRNRGEFSDLLSKLFAHKDYNLYLDLFLEVGNDDISSFAKYLFILFHGLINKEFKVQLATGIGGSADEPNIRICSYAIAGFQFLQKVVPNGIENFRFRLFSTYNARISLGLVKEKDKKSAMLLKYKKNAEDSLNYFYFYLEKFHPSLKDYVSFEVDSINGYELVKRHANGFEEYCENDIKCTSVKKRVQEMAEKYDTTYSESLTYAFSHPFGFGDVLIDNDSAIELKLWKGALRFKNPNAIISLGGNAERSFNGVRDAATRYMRSRVEVKASFPDVARLITKSGSSYVGKSFNPCVYYSVEGDISCEHFAEADVKLEKLQNNKKKLYGDIKVIFDDLKEELELTDNGALFHYQKLISEAFAKISE